jgi:hypothetical protein
VARKPTDYVQFKLRIREALRRKIERAAALRDHSANAEAVWRIERTFEQDEAIAEAARDMEVREAEIQEQWRQHIEEEARRKAKYEASLRDSAILNIILRDQPLLRTVARLLDDEDNPRWRDTPESRKAFADRLHGIIVNNEFSGDDE